MKVPYLYSYRNLWARKLTTLLTAGGMALVVFVFAAVLMLDAGLQKTLVDTGSWDNVVVTRRGAESEVQSIVDRAQANTIESQPEVALGIIPGGTGTARLTSPGIGLKWGIPCGNGADPEGITFTPPRAAQGKQAKVLVTASSGSRWEVRIDESALATK